MSWELSGHTWKGFKQESDVVFSLWGNPTDGLVGMEVGLAPAWNKEVAVKTQIRGSGARGWDVLMQDGAGVGEGLLAGHSRAVRVGSVSEVGKSDLGWLGRMEGPRKPIVRGWSRGRR